MRIDKIQAFFFKYVHTILFAILVFLFVFFRFYNISDRFEFHHDSSELARVAQDFWIEKKLVLGFPNFTLNFENKHIYWSALPTYSAMILYLASGFNPFVAIQYYIFICLLTLLLMYYAVKQLANWKAALLVCIFFSLYPVFVRENLQIWPAHMQVVFWPWIVYFIARYFRSKNPYNLLFSGVAWGFILHFQLVSIPLVLIHFVILAILCKKKRLHSLWFLAGVALPLLPFLAFDIKNNFYNTRIVIGFISQKLASGSNNTQVNNFGLSFLMVPHYYYPYLMYLVILVAVVIKNKLNTILLLAFLLAFIILALPTLRPLSGFSNNKPINFSYKDELYTNSIISANIVNLPQNLLNISNLPYDNLAVVQRYLLRSKGINLNWGEYYKNEYLFAIDADGNFDEYSAYEISLFRPREIINSWPINSEYSLYLLRRKTN